MTRGHHDGCAARPGASRAGTDAKRLTEQARQDAGNPEGRSPEGLSRAGTDAKRRENTDAKRLTEQARQDAGSPEGRSPKGAAPKASAAPARMPSGVETRMPSS